MKLLSIDCEFNKTIELAKNLNGIYGKEVIFHCYWLGNLNEKHFYSILSFYYFNVYKNKHKIILWLESNKSNNYNEEIEKYAQIKYFSLEDEIKTLNYNDIYFRHSKKDLTEYADFIRLLLLYNYGGCWFDLDCFCLRSFDPLFFNYGNNICMYKWAYCNYPNNAIVISLEPKSENMKKTIDFFHNQNTGWRTQSNCEINSPINILVLPCSWFDPIWEKTEFSDNFNFSKFFESQKEVFKLNYFFQGAFCYHWHNMWNKTIEKNSPMYYLVNDVKNMLNIKKILVIISSKSPNPYILNCIDTLYNIQFKDYSNNDFKICVIDSDSDNFDNYDIIKNKFPSVEIHFIKNKNYELGAWKLGYELYPDYDTYFCLQDSMLLENKIDLDKINDKIAYSMNWNTKYFSDETRKNRAIELLENVDLEYNDIIDNKFPIVLNTSFIVNNNVLKDIINTFINLPVKKLDSIVTEGLIGIYFVSKKIKVFNVADKIKKFHGKRN